MLSVMMAKNPSCSKQDFQEYQFIKESSRNWSVFICIANLVLSIVAVSRTACGHLSCFVAMPLDLFIDQSPLLQPNVFRFRCRDVGAAFTSCIRHRGSSGRSRFVLRNPTHLCSCSLFFLFGIVLDHNRDDRPILCIVSRREVPRTCEY